MHQIHCPVGNKELKKMAKEKPQMSQGKTQLIAKQCCGQETLETQREERSINPLACLEQLIATVFQFMTVMGCELQIKETRNW